MGRRLLKFVHGMGSALLILPPPHVHPRGDLSGGVLQHSDLEAMRNDWRLIGRDFTSAIDIASVDIRKHVQQEKQES